MNMAKQTAMLIFTDAKENNNKFYELILEDNDMVKTRWGRVGAEGQVKIVAGGINEFNRIMHSKTAKGYVLSKTVAVNLSGKSGTNGAELSEAAKRDMLGSDVDTKDPNKKVLVSLIERLTQMNRHQIMMASSGNIQIDDSGLIKTPLGLVTSSTIDEAREVLEKIENYVTKKNFTSDKYIQLLEGYLKLIPQKVPTRRGWYENFFTDFTSLTAQGSFLDQLESSIDLYKDKEKQAREAQAKSGAAPQKVFQTQLSVVKDQKIIDTINKYFGETRNSSHASSHLKLKNVYELKNEEFEKRFQESSKKIGNVKRFWHGTRAFNVLSILKGGLIIPKSGGSYHISGRMFGNGVYFSDQSTKSLNYSYGYWDGGAKDDNCFMFLADVAMGKEYVPSGPSSALPMKGYDSTFAKAGKSGVMNNEMIVYSLNQIFLRYLCEFSSK